MLLGLGALIMMGCGVLDHSPLIAGGGAAMAGLLVVSRLVADWRSGVTSSNWGTWRHDTDQRKYFYNVCFWAVVAALWFFLGIMVMAGLLRMPTP